MATATIQDRTSEFRSILLQAQRKQSRINPHQQRQSLLTPSEKSDQANTAPTRKQRSEFTRKAADIGRGISGTTAKLERLAQLAKRKTLFDDRPVEIAELTYVIKQDLSALNQHISQLQGLQKAQLAQNTGSWGGGGGGGAAEQEGEHNKNVVVLLQGKLADVSVNFKEVLEVRTRNIQASRSRTENFVSSVGAHAQPGGALGNPNRTDSPLYSTPSRGRSPKPGNSQDILSLDPGPQESNKALGGPQSEQQMLLMEEAQPQNSYISQRGEAIEAIERTISELGGIFGQLSQMVSEQSEMIQRIDANTEDVVDNVQGAQRELLKYWSRVSGNRWLVAKMFGVLMICKSPRLLRLPCASLTSHLQSSSSGCSSLDPPQHPHDSIQRRRLVQIHTFTDIVVLTAPRAPCTSSTNRLAILRHHSYNPPSSIPSPYTGNLTPQ